MTRTDTTFNAPIVPVILCGGSGKRLWPLSREDRPKPFIAFGHDRRTLLTRTLDRVSDPRLYRAPIIVANEAHAGLIKATLADSDSSDAVVLLEPEGRDTAAAIAAAAQLIALTDPTALMLVLPSDHLIGDTDRFQEAVRCGVRSARNGMMVTFGVTPTAPDSGYGYIAAGTETAEGTARQVERFIEKPEREVAQALIDQGNVYWNGGIFLFRADVLTSEMQLFEPTLFAGVRKAITDARAVRGGLLLSAEAYGRVRKVSIDYALMEKTLLAVVVPTSLDWSDIGNWNAVWDISDKPANGNVEVGRAALEDSRNCYIHSEERLVAGIGLEDLVVVDTADAVLVAHRDRAQDLKTLVANLEDAKVPEAKSSKVVYRPWGHYESINRGPGHQVKRISVTPGEQLSLQYHHHRSEHWVVTTGQPTVTVGDTDHHLEVGQSIFIPLGAVHRLANDTDRPVEIIEVQIGAYLGEDDIVRLEDRYGRAPREEMAETA